MTSQGSHAVAIGYLAGETSQGSNSIILNASATDLSSSTTDAFFVSPIRAATTSNTLYYNTTTKEITEGAGSPIYAYYNQPTESSFASGTDKTVSGWTTVRQDTGFSMSGTGRLTIASAGWYKIHGHARIGITSGTRTTSYIWFKTDSGATDLTETYSAAYNRVASGGNNATCSISFLFQTTTTNESLDMLVYNNQEAGVIKNDGTVFLIESI
jgi:hypothetical protein